MRLEDLLEHLGIEVDEVLLSRALTHSSWVNEHPGEGPSNERMEFLGDAVLGAVISEELFRRHPDLNEGALSAMRSAVVRAETLATAAESLGIGERLLLGRGESISGGQRKESVLSNAFEAVVAAVYLSAGLEAAADFIRAALSNPMDSAPGDALRPDPKSALDRYAQLEGKDICYRIVGREGPDHDPRFTVEVCLDGRAVSRATEGSKQRAEERAAIEALNRLGID